MSYYLPIDWHMIITNEVSLRIQYTFPSEACTGALDGLASTARCEIREVQRDGNRVPMDRGCWMGRIRQLHVGKGSYGSALLCGIEF